ncbi:hypothetical protein [Agreia sp. VKM Ac-1783]|uniref:hypothetical protein n=1 Tax=Agreia sp. VKM Ac-1783 TaxID=1938889 RepID=UPI000A2ADB43|nr:hypothetical protein [Agreia sp. VKM Ac-1783]SMQ71619.1 hypothetical protein SAMN06295943_2526 [Agreia sp. VKM Ac-1783]
MGERRLVRVPPRIQVVRAAFAAAGTGYVASCALGVGVASGLVDLRGARWAHHVAYLVTLGLGGLAASSLLWSSSRSGWLLLPAAGPLAALAYLGPRMPRHPLVALAAAPFFVAAFIHSRK